jgi:lipase chaperone LimK
VPSQTQQCPRHIRLTRSALLTEKAREIIAVTERNRNTWRFVEDKPPRYDAKR